MKDKLQFNLRVNQEEKDLIEELRNKHAINVSGAFKIFLRQMLKRLNKSLEEPRR